MGKWSCSLAFALALWAVVGCAQAAGTRADVRKQVEASMLLQGTLDIDEAGGVTGYQLKQADALPKAMLDFVDRRIRMWRFEPVQVDGKAVRARAPMQVRLVTKRDGEHFLLRIAGASFGTLGTNGESPTARGKLRPPRYPDAAVRNGVSGTVYLVLRIGRDGAVEDAIAEQVNLRAVGDSRQMTSYRDLLAGSAIAAARKWQFDYPTRGEDAQAPFVSVRVPVDYFFDRQSNEAGEWEAYVPGPRQRAPWLPPESDGPTGDALAAWGIYPVGKGPKLLTPLGDS